MSNFKIQTFSGQLVDFLDPDPETIKIEDIAKGLSQEARFHAQSRLHYSVGQHSIMVAGLMPPSYKLEGLLHDAEEAYIKDLSPHLVNAMGRGAVNQYKFLKKKFQKVIREKFKATRFGDLVTLPLHNFIGTVEDFIKRVDNRMSITERDALFKEPYKYPEHWYIADPYSALIHPEAMINIESRFLKMFDMYRRDGGSENVDITNLREDRG